MHGIVSESVFESGFCEMTEFGRLSKFGFGNGFGNDSVHCELGIRLDPGLGLKFHSKISIVKYFWNYELVDYEWAKTATTF